MTEDQLRLLPSEYVEIGYHTMTHPVLPAINERRLAEELMGSRAKLEAMLKREVKLFSFPYGAFDERVVDRCREARYERVFTALPILAFAKPLEFVTGRVGATPSDWPIEFRLKLAGAYRWLPYAFALKRRLLSIVRGSEAAPLDSSANRHYDVKDKISMSENEGRVVDILVEIMKAKGLAVPAFAPDTTLENLGLNRWILPKL